MNCLESILMLLINFDSCQLILKFYLFVGTFPGGPGVKNPLSNTRVMGSVPDRGTKILHTLRIFSTPQLEKPAHCNEAKKEKKIFLAAVWKRGQKAERKLVDSLGD